MNESINNLIKELSLKYNLKDLEIVSNPKEFIIILLSEITGYSIADIKLSNKIITKEHIEKLNELLKQITVQKMPLEYVVNAAYIYGYKFYINENVLIPRQDTETLIEVSCKLINENNYMTLLDICTGSGIIGITLSKISEIKNVLLSDISSEALQVANENIKNIDTYNKCKSIRSDLFKNLYNLNASFDIIVSNPPYLTSFEMNNISDFMKNEPSIALDGGKDGLKFYKAIIDKARDFLNNNGSLVLEIGYKQADDVVKIIMNYEEYFDIKVIKDINNKDRVVVCRFQKKSKTNYF